MDSRTRLLYWLLNASKGGPTRVRILKVLGSAPMNTRKLAQELGMDYKTVQAHMGLLVENGVIYTPKQGYGSVYFISPELDNNEFIKGILRDGNGSKKRKK
ncbi:MAG TPA: winged helix-turn-helix domain-containing protein [Candidatus Bilamarchaeaceae archaeon]|nr:winged helix-turn-helix domain-containing protein [Candidatus Bilamarchaeaceae archaeon]